MKKFYMKNFILYKEELLENHLIYLMFRFWKFLPKCMNSIHINESQK